jgi:DNA-binding NtrC family response regulator
MADQPHILVVEDDKVARDNLVHILARDAYRIDTANGGIEALKQLKKENYDLVLTDLRMEKVDGLEVLRRAKELLPDCEVIMITGFATVNSAISTMKHGAFHYVAKPYKIDEVRALVAQALEKKRLKDQVRDLRHDLRAERGIPFIVGKNHAVQDLVKMIRRIALSDCNVLILGETGTGKELFARAVHHASPRAERRFLAFNCGAFTEELLANELFGHEKDAFTGATSAKKGLLEAADGGTVLLDEIGDMPPPMQVKLLRVIEDRLVFRVGGTDPVSLDIRIVAATNRDLKKRVEEGRFRSDLYYRLNVMSLVIPPLAGRKDDIPLLAHHFVEKFAGQQGKNITGIDDDMMEILSNYPFPGNVRELENVIERAVALAVGDTLSAQDLPDDLKMAHFRTIRAGVKGLVPLAEMEMEYIDWVLSQTGDNKSRAAKVLGIDRASLWRKLKKSR